MSLDTGGTHAVSLHTCSNLYMREWVVIVSYFYKNLFRDPQFKKMLDLFAMLKKGYCDKTKVRIGRLQNLISSSCIGNVHV